MSAADLADSRNRARQDAAAALEVVAGDVVRDRRDRRRQRAQLAARARPWLIRNRVGDAAQAAPRDGADIGLLEGTVEVDESFVGGEEMGVRGRYTEKKAKVIIAVERRGQQRSGRVRLRRIDDFYSDTLIGFVKEFVKPGSVVVTDGSQAYRRLSKEGYEHVRFSIAGAKHPDGTKVQAHEVMPSVHRVSALLKRWLLGTHQGAASKELLGFYLAEFAFRFNRRLSRHRGLLFYRLAEQAMQTDPHPYVELLTPPARKRRKRKITMARKKRAAGKVGPSKNVPRRNPSGPAAVGRSSPTRPLRRDGSR